MTTFDLTPPNGQQMQQCIATLDDEERRVLLHQGTEVPFCGVFLSNHAEGVYVCRLCGLPLFRSNAKFNSQTGWPSFFTPYAHDHIRRVADHSFGMTRTEIVCVRCSGHLGHVFPDGPPPTHERYCINSVSLAFVAKGMPFPNPLGRDGAESGVVE